MVGANTFSLVTSDRTQDNSTKVWWGKFGLDIRRMLFSQSLVRLPGEAVMALDLPELMKRFGQYCQAHVGVLVAVQACAGSQIEILVGPFQLRILYDCVNINGKHCKSRPIVKASHIIKIFGHSFSY